MQGFDSCNAEPDAKVSLLVLVPHPVAYNVTSPAAYIIHCDYSLHCDSILDYSFYVCQYEPGLCYSCRAMNRDSKGYLNSGKHCSPSAAGGTITSIQPHTL